jgi:serine/threonine-protein kinase
MNETKGFDPNATADTAPGTVAHNSTLGGSQTAADGGTVDRGPATVDLPDAGAAPPLRKRELPTVPGYEILAELGRGAMGVVYKARQARLKRLVALKMVLAGAHASPQQLARFDQEARSVARLQHPNIVQIYEIGEHGGLPYFSLEFVDGGTLHKHIDRNPQPPRMAAELVQTLAQAMHFAHEQNIIHRDLKPDNVLLTRSAPRTAGSVSLESGSRTQTTTTGQTLDASGADAPLTPKISDFGLAKTVEADGTQNTASGAIMGTPSYMAPEQARGDTASAGPLCDLYSLGAILYELLTGRPPFQGATILDTLDQVRNREPVPVHQLQPKVPADLETICLKCLQKEPARRYATCGELADDLGRFLAGHPIHARPISGAERAWRWCRRNPWVAGLGATAAVLLVCIAVGAVVVAVRMAAKNKTIQTEKEAAIKAQCEAQKSEQDAIAARNAADQNAREAATQAGIALGALQTLVKQVQDRLDEVAGTQQLKEDLLQMALGEVDKVNKAAEKSTSIEATRMSALMQLGHLYKQLGKSPEAMAQYRKVYEIAKARVVLKKGTDASRLNLAMSLRTLADMDREVARDMQAVLAHEKEQLAIFEDIDQHPKVDENGDGSIPKKDVKANLAEVNRRIGIVYLRLGDIPRAEPHFQKTLDLHRELYAAVETDPKAKPIEKLQQRLNVTVALLAIGDAAYRLGDPARSSATFAESIRSHEEMLGQNPKSILLKRGLAGACILAGDFSLRSGDATRAAALYGRTQTLYAELAQADPKKFDYKWDLGNIHYRRGQLALRTKDAAAAKTHFQDCLTIRQQLADKDAINDRRKTELMLVLAHCGDHARAAGIAAELGKTIKPDAEFLIDVARCYAQCAAATPADDALRSRYTQAAIQAVETAAKLGYRDIVYLTTEVDFDPLRKQGGFGQVLDAIRRRADNPAAS